METNYMVKTGKTVTIAKAREARKHLLASIHWMEENDYETAYQYAQMAAACANLVEYNIQTLDLTTRNGA